MREPLKDRERLEHMLLAIGRILRYTNGKTFQDLVDDDMMYYAVVKNIEIIGEAAKYYKSRLTDILLKPIGDSWNRNNIQCLTLLKP